MSYCQKPSISETLILPTALSKHGVLAKDKQGDWVHYFKGISSKTVWILNVHILQHIVVPLKWTEIVTCQVKGWLHLQINTHISLHTPVLNLTRDMHTSLKALWLNSHRVHSYLHFHFFYGLLSNYYIAKRQQICFYIHGEFLLLLLFLFDWFWLFFFIFVL